jgi:hypothetical protein
LLCPLALVLLRGAGIGQTEVWDLYICSNVTFHPRWQKYDLCLPPCL